MTKKKTTPRKPAVEPIRLTPEQAIFAALNTPPPPKPAHTQPTKKKRKS